MGRNARVPTNKDVPPIEFHSVPLRPNGDCLEWTQSIMKNGYGHFAKNDIRWYAHRLSWRLYTGKKIPEGMVIRHACDNKICVNPKHLLLGTHKDNRRDAMERNRMPKGERHHASRLKNKDVQLIRFLGDCGVRPGRLAKLYDFDPSGVTKIMKRKLWSHLPDLQVTV